MDSIYYVITWLCHRTCDHCYDDRFRPYPHGAPEHTNPGPIIAHLPAEVGKILLAWGPPDILERLLAKPTYIRYTKNTITNPKALQREIAVVRKQRWALDDEEEEIGVRCVAVPVFQEPGRFVAGLSVTGTTSQIPMPDAEAIAKRLHLTAAAIFAPAGLPVNPEQT